MLEISLSMVAAFAAFAFYTIAGDEIRASRAIKNTGKKQSTETKAKNEKAPTVQVKKTASKAKPSSPKKTREIKTEKPADLVSITADSILAYLTANGSVTVTKLTKELQTDKAIVMSAVEKLINEKSALSIKRGGYPAIAPRSVE
jgi:hypothetical protein